MDEELQIKLRPYDAEKDFPFVVNSWLNSSHELFPARKINKKYFNKVQTPILASVISTSNILIACNSEDSNHIFGYLIYERLGNEVIIHWLYTKKELRNFGIAKQLIGGAIPEFTKQPIAITSIPNLQKNQDEGAEKVDVLRRYNLVYDPFIINRKVI